MGDQLGIICHIQVRRCRLKYAWQTIHYNLCGFNQINKFLNHNKTNPLSGSKTTKLCYETAAIPNSNTIVINAEPVPEISLHQTRRIHKGNQKYKSTVLEIKLRKFEPQHTGNIWYKWQNYAQPLPFNPSCHLRRTN